MPARKIHYVSGIIIALFIGLHLFNHLCSLGGAEKHIAVMNTFRLIYRNKFAEPVLLFAVLVQFISGLKLWNAKRKTATSGFEKLQLWTGFYLAVFFMVHVSVVLAGRFVLHLDTNFYFGVAGINTFPFTIFFIPYYGLAILSFFGHLAAVHSKRMKQKLFGLTANEQSKAILVVGVFLTLVIFYGLTAHFKGVTVPKEYNVLIGK